MQRIRSILRIIPISGIIVLLIGIHPVLALADATSTDPTSTTSTTTPSGSSNTSSQSQTGPTKPPGPDSSTYTYNSATGLWENDYYTWNPATGQTTPKSPPTYSYNPSSGMWDTTKWIYDPASGKYVPNVITVTQPPPDSNIVTPQGGPSANAQVNTPTTSNPTNNNANNGTNNNNTNNATFDSFYNPTISNNLTSNAKTGDTAVSGNTTAGSATSGNALSIANVLNLLQSSASFGSGNLATFTSNITGNVQGDILIDPGSLALPTSGPVNNPMGALQLNMQNNGQINNNIALDSTSGNATVSKNTTAGNATSGSASSMADVINLINSAITAKQSFLGLINIYGNLQGNILVPQNFLDSLLANNNSSTVVPDPNQATSTSITQLNNQTINNNVTAAAASGQANVSNNTSAGNATSGNANTKVTILNLTGQQVIAKNSLLVFVNVLGTWVGLIMNAPAGSTAAALGGGVSQNNVLPASTDITATNNSKINNNISVKATSGDASVTGNTSAGNATSGNALASADLSNFIGSQLNLSNWFGILFINVFGSWYGNFGAAVPKTTSQNSGSTNNVVPETTQTMHVFQFIPNGTTASIVPLGGIGGGESTTPAITKVSTILPSPQVKKVAPTTSSVRKTSLGSILLVVAGSIGLVALAVEQVMANRRRHHITNK